MRPFSGHVACDAAPAITHQSSHEHAQPLVPFARLLACLHACMRGDTCVLAHASAPGERAHVLIRMGGGRRAAWPLTCSLKSGTAFLTERRSVTFCVDSPVVM